MHATIVNSKSYTLLGALGSEQIRFGPKYSALVSTNPQIGDTMPLPSPTGFVDTAHCAVRYPSSSPANGTCAQASSTNASYFKTSEEVNGVDHTPSRDVSVHCTPYMVDSIAAGVARGTALVGCIAPAQNPAKEADSKYKENPCAPCQQPENLYVWCPRMLCHYLFADGTRCLQVITCDTVSTHFAGHGVEGKSRAEEILCRWEGCFQPQKRHNFVRHVREAHLGHRRGTAIHNRPGDERLFRSWM